MKVRFYSNQEVKKSKIYTLFLFKKRDRIGLTFKGRTIDMNIKKARLIDMGILTLVAAVGDLVAYWATSLGVETYTGFFYLAPSICVLIFIYARWQYFGIIPNIILLGIQLILYRAQIFVGYQLVIPFVLGYLSLILYVPIANTRYLGFKTVTKKVLGFIITYFLVVAIESILGLIFNSGIGLASYFYRHLINMILCLILFVVASLQKNFIVPMQSYLRLITLEKQKKPADDQTGPDLSDF